MRNWHCVRYKNETVAIKMVHKGETPEEIAKREARFAREVAMLSRVQHKNLVKVGLRSYFCCYLLYLYHYMLVEEIELACECKTLFPTLC